MSRAEHDIFLTRLTKACLMAKSDIDLFTEGGNFLQDVINRAHTKLIPLGNQKVRLAKKVDNLKEIGFLTDFYANNCKQIYAIRNLYDHPQKNKDGALMTKQQKKKRANELCRLFIGTPAAKLLNAKRSPYFEKYSEATINTLLEIDNCLYQGINTQSLGRVISKSESRKLRKKAQKKKSKN